jgi:hypothetical protein
MLKEKKNNEVLIEFFILTWFGSIQIYNQITLPIILKRDIVNGYPPKIMLMIS